MSSKHRISVQVSDKARIRLKEMAENRGMQTNDLVRLALGLLDEADRAREDGYYVGIARNRSDLAAVFVMPL